jgi:hypothetical protein
VPFPRNRHRRLAWPPCVRTAPSAVARSAGSRQTATTQADGSCGARYYSKLHVQLGIIPSLEDSPLGVRHAARSIVPPRAQTPYGPSRRAIRFHACLRSSGRPPTPFQCATERDGPSGDVACAVRDFGFLPKTRSGAAHQASNSVCLCPACFFAGRKTHRIGRPAARSGRSSSRRSESPQRS